MEENSPNASAALTKTEKTGFARNKVFGTTELLEGILLYLADDFQTLLLSQRVCKTFHTTIEHSTLLQKALFSISDPSTYKPIPSILNRRKIKFSHDGATFHLQYMVQIQECGGGAQSAGIDLGLSYEDMSPDMRARVDEYVRAQPVELYFSANQRPCGNEREVEVGGSWQKIPLMIHSHQIRGEFWCGCDGLWGHHFDVEVVEGDTMGSVVNKALWNLRARSSDLYTLWDDESAFAPYLIAAGYV